MNKLLYDDLTYKIIGAAKSAGSFEEVYPARPGAQSGGKELGPGFLPAWQHHSDRESVYPV